MKKKEKLSKTIFSLISIALILIVIVTSFFIYRYIDAFINGDGIVTKYKTDLYAVPSNANDYQIEIYEELAKECNDNEDMTIDGGLENIAALVVKSFIADHFTWSNKKGSYDVGGLDYVYGPQFLNIQSQARYYYYSDLDLLIEKYGSDYLPTVQNIAIAKTEHGVDKFYFGFDEFDFDQDEYVTREVAYDYYLVSATWGYFEAEGYDYDVSNLPNRGLFMVVNRDGRLEIAYYHEAFY